MGKSPSKANGGWSGLAGLRMSSLLRGVSAAVLVGLMLGAGCAGPKAGFEGTSPGRADPAGRSGTAAAAPEEAISYWVRRALDGATPDEIARGTRRREQAYFLELLGQLANETKDVGPVVRHAARALVLTGGTPGAAVVVRELWARECCMRRSFLAAGLWGVVDGLEALSAMPVQEAATAISLGELVGHADPEVGKAAGKAGRYFTVEPPER